MWLAISTIYNYSLLAQRTDPNYYNKSPASSCDMLRDGQQGNLLFLRLFSSKYSIPETMAVVTELLNFALVAGLLINKYRLVAENLTK